MMDHRERFFRTIGYEQVDRPASWLGLPVPGAEKKLLAHFGASFVDEMKIKLDDDIYSIEVPYSDPPSNHIACAFKFVKSSHIDTPEKRTLTAPGLFEDYDDPANVGRFDWPDPEIHLDREASLRRAKSAPGNLIRMGILWSAHFQDACSAFGMEKALITMLTNPDMFSAFIDRITRSYLRANEIFFESTKGCLDCMLIGNDSGSQTGMMVYPDSIREFVFPGTRLLIKQAKSYRVRVVHHSCGSIFLLIEDMIGLDADIVHPIQALAKYMDAQTLHYHFGGRIAFCVGVDAQYLLMNETPAKVTQRVQEMKKIFPTGLILSPSHEAILPDLPLENIRAMFHSINSLQR